MTLSGYSTYCAQQAYSGRMELHEMKEDYFRRLATFDIGTPGVKYGADQANTDLFKCTSVFELNDVHTILKGTSLEEVPGLVRKYGYFGCYGSSFAAHVWRMHFYTAPTSTCTGGQSCGE
nr:PREDICTED: uncharacterized protein LOC109033689 [Bemisia tabaci]